LSGPNPPTPSSQNSSACLYHLSIGSPTMAEPRAKSPGPNQVAQPDAALPQAGWTNLFGRPPPKGMSRCLLELVAAYEAPARLHDGLKPAVRRRLLQAAQSASGLSNEKPRRRAPATLSPGSRLVREWHGRSHMVEVLENGFLYDGHRYRSLSSIAQRITGARWSGRRFFGL
jgi:hypothetical protein